MATDSAWAGARLRELREAARLSQQELADVLAVSRETVARWETDQREPNWTNVRAMAAALGTTCEAFNQQPAQQDPPKKGRPKKQDDAPALAGQGGEVEATTKKAPRKKKGGG